MLDDTLGSYNDDKLLDLFTSAPQNESTNVGGLFRKTAEEVDGLFFKIDLNGDFSNLTLFRLPHVCWWSFRLGGTFFGTSWG